MNDDIFKQEEKQQSDVLPDPLVDENYSPSTIPNDGHWKCSGCAFQEHCNRWFKGEVP